MATTKSTRKVYRSRVKASKCRGKRASSCRQAPGCKIALGKKRTFCRKNKNTKTRKSGGGMGYNPRGDMAYGKSRRHHNNRRHNHNSRNKSHGRK